jgi:hypothetical protein
MATHLALGTASENLVLKAHELGLNVKLTPPRDANSARVCFRFFGSTADRGDLEEHAYDTLSRYLDQRHTNRRRVVPEAISDEVLDALRTAVQSLRGCHLELVSDAPAIAEVADIIARAERIRMLHPVGHRDLTKEIRWTPEEASRTGDGIDLQTIELTASEAAGLRLLRPPAVPRLLRRWKGGRGLEKLSREALQASSAVGVISAPGSSAFDLFHAGRAIQRCWLLATGRQLSLQPHTAAPYLIARACGGGAGAFDPTNLGELYSLHARLRAVFGANEHIAFLFRLFQTCQPPKRSLRREPTWLSS